MFARNLKSTNHFTLRICSSYGTHETTSFCPYVRYQPFCYVIFTASATTSPIFNSACSNKLSKVDISRTVVRVFTSAKKHVPFIGVEHQLFSRLIGGGHRSRNNPQAYNQSFCWIARQYCPCPRTSSLQAVCKCLKAVKFMVLLFCFVNWSLLTFPDVPGYRI